MSEFSYKQRHLYIRRLRIFEPKLFGSRVITAAASQGLAAGSLLADRNTASPAHRSADPETSDAGIAPL